MHLEHAGPRAKILVTAVAALVAVWTPRFLAAAQSGEARPLPEGPIELELPADRSQIVERFKITPQTWEGLVLESMKKSFWIRGEAPIEFEAAVGGPKCNWGLEFKAYSDLGGRTGFTPLGRTTFRRLFPEDENPVRGRDLVLELGFIDNQGASDLMGSPPDEDSNALPTLLRSRDWECELVVRLSRHRACTMWARVTGDANGTYFGDFAFFNTFDAGVEITTGTAADPGMHQLLQDYMGSLGDFAKIAESMGQHIDPEILEKLQTGTEEDPDAPSEAQAELLRLQNEMFSSGGDTFGLTLADGKFDEERPEAVNDLDTSDLNGALAEVFEAALGGGEAGATGALTELLGGGTPGALAGLVDDDVLQTVKTFAGAFTLEASGNSDFEWKADQDTVPLTKLVVPLTGMRVVPGIVDGNLERVPFVWQEGSEGSAELTLEAHGGDYIAGQINGTLFSEATYNGRRLSIDVAATFGARRGFRSCLR